MKEFKDLTRITTVATIAVGIHMLADLLAPTADLRELAGAQKAGVYEEVFA